MSAIMFGIEGQQLLPHEAQYLQSPSSAGVILFTRNYDCPEQLQTLCQSIRAIAPDTLIGVDHEGGRVQRFRQHFTELPPAGNIGALFDEQPILATTLAQASGTITAYELRQYDIDFSFAPVLDLADPISSVIGNRAYHRNPAIVSELSQAFRRGLRTMGMAAVGKHYPGHGRVVGDSHHVLPIDQRSEAQRQSDIYPFVRNIDSHIEAIMPAHIVYPQDDELPAGFSSKFMHQLRKLGFNGAIITDDLDMAGAAVISDPLQRVQTALNAGADTTLICNNFADIAQSMAHNFQHQNRKQSQQRLKYLRATALAPKQTEMAYNSAKETLAHHANLLV